MKFHYSKILVSSGLACALAACAGAQPPRGRRQPPPPQAMGAYTTVSGSISQYNYNRDGDVEGFLLGNRAVVHLPPRASTMASSSFHVGDSVEVAGYVQTSPSGFQQVEAQNIKDHTSGKTLAVPQPGPAAPFSGTGRIQQLNYGPDGAVNGFLLRDGKLATVPPFDATNPSSIRVGANVAFSGYARRTMSDRTVVDIQSLTINGQQMALAGDGSGGPPPPPPPGADAPPPPPGPPAGARAALPPGRTDQPPPPAPPADAPPPPQRMAR